MNDVFLVFGYGVPRDILKDENYNFYLKMVFNKIYDFVVKNNIEKPIIIFCGGETDVIKPYRRNEADEMIKFFTTLIKERPFLKSLTQNWLFLSEKESLSTLENLINSKKIISKRKIKKANFYVFCEQTRQRRIKLLAKKIFDKNYNFLVVPIDFDVSANRYLPAEYLAKKESTELKHSLWALQSPENLKKHHKVFEEKFEYFRKVGHKAHVNAVKEWWDQKLKELKN
ncbi:MAG: ElyC/SanA/YdcF family protein [bacterium]|nr:ElyC/SanA/YdcF family protein [bacterium]